MSSTACKCIAYLRWNWDTEEQELIIEYPDAECPWHGEKSPNQ